LPRIPHTDGILVTTRPRVGDVRGVSELLERGAGRLLVSQIDRQKPQRLGRWTAWACGALLEGEIAAKFPAAVLSQPKVKRLLSSGHFAVDGTLIEAWASIMTFFWKDSGTMIVRVLGATPSETSTGKTAHQSTTDPGARLYKKGDGQPGRLCYKCSPLPCASHTPTTKRARRNGPRSIRWHLAAHSEFGLTGRSAVPRPHRGQILE